jgi:hypothetical protein
MRLCHKKGAKLLLLLNVNLDNWKWNEEKIRDWDKKKK